MDFSRIQRLISNILKEEEDEPRPHAGSYPIKDKRLIAKFIRDPQKTFLVSFPRTGSHWLRMIMELYFERPSLTRVFYYPENTNYLALHTHDLDLETKRKKVIYLYRHPIPTVYSQLKYLKLDVNDVQQVIRWSDEYGKHLAKWLHCEDFTNQKTIIQYEQLKNDLVDEFSKVCAHFGETLQEEILLDIADRITMEHVQSKTGHDPQVINTSREYQDGRGFFSKKYGDLVMETVLSKREFLRDYVANETRK